MITVYPSNVLGRDIVSSIFLTVKKSSPESENSRGKDMQAGVCLVSNLRSMRDKWNRESLYRVNSKDFPKWFIALSANGSWFQLNRYLACETACCCAKISSQRHRSFQWLRSACLYFILRSYFEYVWIRRSLQQQTSSKPTTRLRESLPTTGTKMCKSWTSNSLDIQVSMDNNWLLGAFFAPSHWEL